MPAGTPKTAANTDQGEVNANFTAFVDKCNPWENHGGMHKTMEGLREFEQRMSRDDVVQRDLITLGVAIAAIVLFVGTGSSVVSRTITFWIGAGPRPDVLLTNALLLNVALIIFGWRRHKALTEEVVERRKAEAQARYLAEIDPLTGCLNRRSIGTATDRLLAEAAGRGQSVAMMMIDLDNFKQINDFNGHNAGDLILQECARRIRSALPDGALAARIGGDEFGCAISFDHRQIERIDQIANTMIATVAEPIEVNGVSLTVTVSVGIARSDLRVVAQGDELDAQTLQHMADIAMYQAKKEGRNRYFWFENSMEAELKVRSELVAGIRAGIPSGEFVPYFEQQIDTATGDLVGFEMLARWNSPTLGVVSPEVFIPIAEDIGVIGELSECLIRQALVEARQWDPKLTLSVNISPIQLRDPWFAQKLLKILVEANFPPNRLEIEITESCLHDNIGVVRTLIVSLKNQGIQVSLDDFGTGYSSLAQLRTLPFDRIKIDRSFVTSLPDNKENATIVQAITSLGEGLGLPITAEGIETPEVLDELRRFGSFKGQGYLYGYPETAADTHRKLADLDLLREPEEPLAKPAKKKAMKKPAAAGDKRKRSA